MQPGVPWEIRVQLVVGLFSEMVMGARLHVNSTRTLLHIYAPSKNERVFNFLAQRGR